MGKYEVGSAIIISILLGIILFFLVDGLLALIITAFVATYLTLPEKRSYKVGIFAACIMGLIIFAYRFINIPELPNNLSTGLFIDPSTLLFGFIIFGLVCIGMGALGGYLAEKVLN
ncbi:MAG: hypothetical protein ACP5C3_04845 [Methanomicrobiales archaeon]